MGVAVTPKERMIVQQGMMRVSCTLNGSPNVPLVVALAFDVHGTHVVQRILVRASGGFTSGFVLACKRDCPRDSIILECSWR